MTDSLSTNPFRPGAGRLPGYMGHREAVERPLLETLAASRASFWSRGEKLAVGLLPDGEAHAVLARPFLDAGLEADADAISELARAADDYPYFLQLYGAAGS